MHSEYVEALEKEIAELKSKNRTLRQQIEDISQSAKSPRRGHRETVPLSHGIQPQDPFIQAHIKELNATIGKKLAHFSIKSHKTKSKVITLFKGATPSFMYFKTNG